MRDTKATGESLRVGRRIIHVVGRVADARDHEFNWLWLQSKALGTQSGNYACCARPLSV